jgi:hypothetical protein
VVSLGNPVVSAFTELAVGSACACLFEACSVFTHVTPCTLALSPIRDTQHVVTSIAARVPVCARSYEGGAAKSAAVAWRTPKTRHANGRRANDTIAGGSGCWTRSTSTWMGPQIPAKQIFARRRAARRRLPGGACGRVIRFFGAGAQSAADQVGVSTVFSPSHVRPRISYKPVGENQATGLLSRFDRLGLAVGRGQPLAQKPKRSNLHGRTLCGFATLHTQHVRQARTLAA